MPIVNPDQSRSENQGPKPGRYTAHVLSCELTSSKAGNEMLKWKLEGPYRQWIYLNTTFGGRGLEMFKKIIRATVDPNYESGPINTDACLGKALMITTEAQPESKYLTVVDVEPVDFSEVDNSDIPF